MATYTTGMPKLKIMKTNFDIILLTWLELLRRLFAVELCAVSVRIYLLFYPCYIHQLWLHFAFLIFIYVPGF